MYKVSPVQFSDEIFLDSGKFLKINDLSSSEDYNFACKVIRRLRFGKDTIEKIRKEIITMIKLQFNYPLLIASSFAHLFIDNNCSNAQFFAPKSASPRLYVVHEDRTEVAIVME